MRAGAVRHPEPELQHTQAIEEDAAANPLPPIDHIEYDDILQDLGFEEGEIEIFSEMAEDLVDSHELVQRYLEVAQAKPYNLNWTTVDAARNADYDTDVEKRNGIPYNKHDIANDTLNSFYDVISGHGGRHNRKHKQRKTRKHRKSRKSRKSRRYRRRY